MNNRICRGLLALVSGFFYVCLTAADRPAYVEFQRHGNRIEVTIGGRPFTTYYFGPETAKAYLQPLRSAQGTVITRDFPLENAIPPSHEHDPALEPHQRPMYFAHGNIDGLNFWGEQVFQKYYGGPSSEAYGRMVFRTLSEMRGGTDSGVVRADFDLQSPSGRPIAEETQAFTFRGDDQTRTIDCEFIIKASYGPVVMGDTKEGTFGIRLVPQLNSPPGRMVNSNGAVGEKEIWGTRADWVDYSGTVDGGQVGIAVFDSRKSFRHPTYWHARAYGLFSANPFGAREFTRDPAQDGSWTIIAGQPLVLRYRVLIHRGDHKEARVAEAYQRYAAGQ